MSARADLPVFESLESRLLMDASPMLLAESGDFGDSPVSAEVISLDLNRDLAIEGSIHTGGEEDIFRWSADFTGLLTVNFSRTAGSELDTVVHAYDAGGGFLAKNNNTQGTDSQITFAVVAGETYWLRAAGADGTAGEYTLTLTGLEHADAHGDTPADATGFALDADGSADLDGAIDSRADQDFFRFTADEDLSMTVTMAAGDNALDSMLYVYDSGGNVVAVNDNALGVDAQVRFEAVAGESYVIRATNRAGTVGAYGLTVRSTPLTDDAGDSISEATELTLDDALAANINGVFETHGDVDVYGFTAWFDGEMTLRMDGLDGGMDPTLTVYDADGNEVHFSDDADGLSAELTISLQAGEQYFISAGDFGSATGNYQLIVSATSVDWTPLDGRGAVQDDVLAGVRHDADGSYLYIEGTDGNDEIKIAWMNGQFYIRSQAGLTTLSAEVSSIGVYGFGGSDTITLMHTLTVDTFVFAGGGNDVIYANAAGYSEIYAGEGDDLIVAIDGGLDRVFGQGGYDRFWLDTVDSHDATNAEINAGALHRISTFYQPWTNNTGSANYVSTEIRGQAIRDPYFTSRASYYEDFSDRPLFNGITYNDADQGSLGDCYYLASLSSLAGTDPDLIENMITSLGDGSYAVRYYDGSSEVYLRIDGDLPVNSYGRLVYQGLGEGGDIWMPLMEKAYAHFRTGENTYASLSGGWMSVVYEELTGKSTSYVSMSQSNGSLYQQLESAQLDGHAVTLGSLGSQPSGSPIVSSHAYVVHEVGVDEDGSRYIDVYNPWGVDGRSDGSDYYDGLLRLSLSDVRSFFSAGSMSLA
jgi:hypothetical protein